MKPCGSSCVSDDDPATGCGNNSCSPCPSRPNAMMGCEAGACAVIGCADSFIDCDGSDQTGCEHSPSSFDENACGGCDADCTSLGLSVCAGGECGCANDTQCKGNANAGFGCDTGTRRCECTQNGECNAGETCRKVGGNSAECSCGGNAACGSGWTCCPGDSGANCKQLDANDSSNCGACGWSCPSGKVCSSGICVDN
jgi:hypothetical protein